MVGAGLGAGVRSGRAGAPTACRGDAGPVRKGTVYLVGAGPGAIGCLTLRALEVLGTCDAVLHDRLVPAEIVRLARPGAEVRYVGKDRRRPRDAGSQG